MILYKSNNWEVVFGEWSQEFIGYCIISSNKENLSELTDKEWVELGKLEKVLERVCQKLFGATMFNFSCLMNNAYRDNEKPHVHFHFMPRYKDKIKIFNKTYIDKHFGYNFWKWDLDEKERQEDIFTKEEKQEIYNMIKGEFNIKSI